MAGMAKPNANYRLIAVSILDGALYDIAEFQNYEDLLKHAFAIKRWDIHCIAVETGQRLVDRATIETPKVLSSYVPTGCDH